MDKRYDTDSPPPTAIRYHPGNRTLMDGFAGSWLLQVTDPTAVFDLPGIVRGPSVFVVILLIGSTFVWRYDALLERSIVASTERPLSSLGYGIAAHLTIAFFVMYGVSQLRQIEPSGVPLTSVGYLIGGVMLTVAAAIGFTVVGSAVVEVRWGERRWAGLLVGALTAGLVSLADPLLGGIVWILVVSTGIGGPVRNWFNAAEDV